MHVAHGKNMLEWPNGVLFAIGLMVCTAIYVILQVATIATHGSCSSTRASHRQGPVSPS